MPKISKETLDFLKKLKKNNNRDWFNKNKQTYLSANENFIEFVEQLIRNISQFDKSVAGLDAKKCVFRIYRDVRFSKDKSPYKANFGASINAGGKKHNSAGYYLHIESEKAFLAGGSYMPEPKWLQGIRQEIVYNPKKFLSIINNKDFVKYFKELRGEKLKTAPKGFEKDEPMLEYIKHKDFLMWHEIKDSKITSPDFLKYTTEVFKCMKSLNDFLNAPLAD
jgi:uncharacterized protein (TIGR02453 family)